MIELILVSVMNADPGLTCERVEMVATEIMESYESGARREHIQQSLDEVGDGDSFYFVLEHAFQLPSSPILFGRKFRSECEKLDTIVKDD